MAWEIAVMLGFVGATMAFAFLAVSTEEVSLQYFFTIAIFLMLCISLNAARVIAVENGSSSAIRSNLEIGYIMSLFVFMTVFVYLFILYVMSVFEKRKMRAEQEE